MCNQCEPLMINGVLCHETGCPSAWATKQIECMNCGFDFIPDEKYQCVCNDCIDAAEYVYFEDDEIENADLPTFNIYSPWRSG